MSKKKLYASLQKMNQKLENLMGDLKNYSEDLLNQSPAAEKWTPTQIMNHLILSEKLSLAYCRKKLSFNPTLKKAGLFSTIRTSLIKGYLLSPLKFKAPKFINTPALPQSDTLKNIEQKWTEVRNDMRSFIEELPDQILDKELYKHPFGGRISISGMFSVMDAHFENHKKQLYNYLSQMETR